MGGVVTVPSGGHWHRDPQGFLDQRLRERGLSIQQFLAARPGQSWNQLVRNFDEPLAPIQLMAYIQEAAAKGQWLDWYTRDSLARALSDWLTIMSILGDACHERARQVADRLERAGLPMGWLPDGPDDPLLVAAFQGCVLQTVVDPASTQWVMPAARYIRNRAKVACHGTRFGPPKQPW